MQAGHSFLRKPFVSNEDAEYMLNHLGQMAKGTMADSDISVDSVTVSIEELCECMKGH